jgi:hypothetical protein
MAVTVTDQRTIVNEADATTSWTGSVTVSAITADPNPIEATGCLGQRNNNTTTNAYFTLASTSLTDHLIYAWVFPRTVTDTRTNGGMQIQLGDGTDRIGFHAAGDDSAAFRHGTGPTAWQCLVIDTSQLANYTQTVYAGSFANLSTSAITQIGIAFKGVVAAQGNVPNTYWDIVRYGSVGQGLLITAGTAGDPGLFSQIAVEDRSTANQKAFGIIRELGTGLYGVQGPLTFGDTAGTTATYFADTDTTVVFEDRDLDTDKYSITIQGNATGSTTFKLGLKSGTGDSATGTNGCSIVVPSGVGASFTASDADLQFLLIYGSTLSGFSNGITLSSNATNGPNHEFLGNNVASSGVFDPGRVVVRNCRITGWTGTSTDGALLWGANANVKRCSFTSSGTGHAIKMTAAGTYGFDAMLFSGYGADNTTNAAVYNAATPTTTASYAETNQSGTTSLYSGSTVGAGQSFTADGKILSACRFHLKKTGSPTGNAVCKIYAHSGTLGSSSIPTGAALATSSTLDVSTLTTSYVLTEFKFTGTSNVITLTNATNYVLAIEYSGGSVGNTLDVGTDTSAPTAPGNFSTYNGSSWTAVSGTDACFYLYTDGAITINVTNNGDTPTYRNALGCSTTVNNAVTLSVKVLNALGSAVQNARVGIYKVSDNSEILNALTDVNGDVSTSYAYTSNESIYIRVRKTSTGSTRYINNDSSGTITSTGFSSTVTLLTDVIAAV